MLKITAFPQIVNLLETPCLTLSKLAKLHPKYSAIVVINKPNKSKGFYGGLVAAPVFKKVAQKIITGIPIEIERVAVQLCFPRNLI